MKIINNCLHWIIATGVETLRAKVNYIIECGASKFCSEWTIADTGNSGFVWLGDDTNMDGMGAFLCINEEIKWDSDNGCVYKI